MQNIYGNYSGLVTSPYWQKKHDVMLIQVRIFSGKQNNPSTTWEWPGRDPVWSDAWEASSNFRKNFLKFLPIDTFCNAAGDSVGQEQPAMNVIFLDSLKKTLLCMQALLATHPAEQELSPTQHSGDYHLQFLSSDSNSRKNTCKSRGVSPTHQAWAVPPFPMAHAARAGAGAALGFPLNQISTGAGKAPTRGEIQLHGAGTETTQPKLGSTWKEGKPVLVTWQRRGRGLSMRDFPWRPQSKNTRCEIWPGCKDSLQQKQPRDPYWAFG